MRGQFSIIPKEKYQESPTRRMILHRIHYAIYIVHEKMTNEFGMFEDGQGCVVVLSLIIKTVQSLPLETWCPFYGHAKLWTSC